MVVTDRPPTRRRRRLLGILAAFLAVQMVVAVSGYLKLANARPDPLRRADAVVVLGGEHDGREAYGARLVEDGLAPVLVLSNPYVADDSVMRQMCDPAQNRITIICQRPEPLTTRGEAIMTRDLAERHGWKTVIVVTWRYHIPRARMVFGQCFSPDPASVLMSEVPRPYDLTWLGWQVMFNYQYVGFAKALTQGSCD